MKVVLYYPPIFSIPLVPPYPLLYLASALRKEEHETIIIDGRVEKEPLKKISVECKDAQLFGASVEHDFQALTAIPASKVAKENDCITVWGGVHCSFNSDTLIKIPFVDGIVKGEGEISITEILNKGIRKANNVVYKRQNGEIINNPRGEYVNLNDYSPLPYDLIDMNKYISHYQDLRLIHFSSSRGCPYNCEYCYQPKMWNRHWRSLSVDNTIREIKEIATTSDVNAIFFLDDDFLADLNRATNIAERLSSMNVKWSSETRANYLNDQLIEILRDYGCYKLCIGAESGSQRILDLMNKHLRIEDIKRAATLLRKHELNSEFYFMMGYAGETFEDINKTLDLINFVETTCNAETFLRVAIPFYNTDYYRRVEKLGFHREIFREECLIFWDINPPHLPWFSDKDNMILKNIATLSLMRYKKRNYLEDMKLDEKIFFKILNPLLEIRWSKRLWLLPIELQVYRWFRNKKYVSIVEKELSTIEKELSINLSELIRWS